MTRTYAFYERNGGVHGAETMRPLSMTSLMSKHPLSLTSEDRILDAMNLMREREVRHIPIVDPVSGKLEGLVTELDLLRNVLHGRTLTPAESYHASLDVMLPLSEVMVRQVRTVRVDAPVMEVVGLFLEHKIRCAPVVDGNGRLEGIVTETDLMRLLAHMVGN